MTNEHQKLHVEGLALFPVCILVLSAGLFIYKTTPSWKVAIGLLFVAIAFCSLFAAISVFYWFYSKRLDEAKKRYDFSPSVYQNTLPHPLKVTRLLKYVENNRFSFILCIGILIIAAFGIFSTVNLPRETRQPLILGLSLFRLVMIDWLALEGIAGLMAIRQFFDQYRGEKIRTWLSTNRRWVFLLSSSFFTLCCCFYYLSVFKKLKDPQIHKIFLRLLPLSYWMIVLSGIICLLIIWENWRTIISGVYRIFDRICSFVSDHVIDITAILILIVLSGLIYYPVTDAVSKIPESDYFTHINSTKKMDALGRFIYPHFLYSLLIISLHHLISSISFFELGNAIVVSFHIFSAVIIFTLLRWEIPPSFLENPFLSRSILVILTTLLLLITPITLFTLSQHNLYFGYIGIQVYHNPTIVLLKPLALLLFLIFLNLIQPEKSDENTENIPIFLIMGITTMCTLAKPNYIISILPASGIVFFIALIKKWQIDWIKLFVGIYLPAMIILIWQYISVYIDFNMLSSRSHIILSPFGVYQVYSEWLFPKFILSILFPLGVYLCFFSRAKRDFGLNFAWLTFGFGLFFTYFMAESGVRFRHGNFTWSGEVTLFILFIVSFVFFLKQFHENHTKLLTWLCGLFLLCHLLSGIFWYGIQLFRPLEIWL